MNEEDKRFIDNYEKLLNKGYCDCNEMNCIDNNSPRRILNIVKQLEHNGNELKKWLLCMREVSHLDINCLNATLDKIKELEEGGNNDC